MISSSSCAPWTGFDVPSAQTFVHLDRKADMPHFRAGYSRGATFLPYSQRAPVHWDGYSITQAMLNMMWVKI